MNNVIKDTQFIMLVGLPGSGKSTYVEKKKDSYNVFSSDALRLEMFGDETSQDHNAEVFDELHKRIYESLKNHKSCIYDATNLSRKRRRNFLKTISNFDYVVKYAFVFATDIEVCLAHNKSRDRVVPEDVILNMYKKITIPRIEEGFDLIRVIPYYKNRKLDCYIKDMFNFNQENNYHTLTLDNHCMLTAANIDHEEIRLAALIHDIGKPVCKTFTKYNGEIDTEAHYYNHAEVGAYIYLCSQTKEFAWCKDTLKYITSKSHEKIITMLLIQYHMDFFNQPKNDFGDTDLSKFKELIESIYTEQFYQYLLELHTADICAH